MSESYDSDHGLFPLYPLQNEPLLLIRDDPLVANKDQIPPLNVETTTCWLAADQALQHIRNHLSSITEIFSEFNIPACEYALAAGFNEYSITCDTGYLQEIHVFTTLTITEDEVIPLLVALARVFSPFSGILYTLEISYLIPVFKDDDTVFSIDELFKRTGADFFDAGSRSRMRPTVISVSQNASNNISDHAMRLSGRDASKSPEVQEQDSAETSADGKRKTPGRDPEPSNEGKTGKSVPSVHFDLSTDIEDQRGEVFQKLSTIGDFTIRREPFTDSQFAKCKFEFTGLRFENDGGTHGVAYRPFHLRVEVDSCQETAISSELSPRGIMAFGPSQASEVKMTSTGRNTCGAGVGVQVNPTGPVHLPTVGLLFKGSGSANEQNQYTPALRRRENSGVIFWIYKMDDLACPCQLPSTLRIDNGLPSVKFKFIGASDPPEPPPEHIVAEVASYWSIMGPGDETSLQRFKRFKSIFAWNSGLTASERVFYSNLCQAVVFRVHSDLSAQSFVKSGITVHAKPRPEECQRTDGVHEESFLDIPSMKRLPMKGLPCSSSLLATQNVMYQ